jgi:predicted transcriptional regulator
MTSTRRTVSWGVVFETVCHRPSCNAPQQRAVPYIFARTHKAGNISKHQSAKVFHLGRVVVDENAGSSLPYSSTG